MKRVVDSPFPVRFLVDSSGQVMLELNNNPKLPVPDYASMDPLLVHVAFVCTMFRQRLSVCLKAVASLVAGPDVTPAGDQQAMLRDSWKFPIQLCQRQQPML